MKKTAVASVLAAGTLLAVASSGASAAPTSGLEPLKPLASNGAGVDNVYWGYRRWHHRRHWGVYGIYGGGYRNCRWRHGWRHCSW